jgi:hypothetical protein
MNLASAGEVSSTVEAGASTILMAVRQPPPRRRPVEVDGNRRRDCFDNPVVEAFFSGLQRELLDQHLSNPRAPRPGSLRLDREPDASPAVATATTTGQPRR